MGVVTSEAGAETDREIVVRTLHEEPLKTFVQFKRTVQVRQYEPAEASVMIQLDLERDDSEEDIVGKIRHAFGEAKACVFEQLGLDMEINDEGILVEVVRRGFPGAEVVSDESAERIKSVARDAVAASPPHDPKQVPKGDAGKVQRRENGEWAVARFQTHPNEFWDNRNDKPTDRHPDIKHKDTGVGGWMD